MDETLQTETDRLIRSWERHDPAFLRDYLVASVEDPRVNWQSILTRHFLLTSLFERRFAELMEQELLFAAALNWLRRADAFDPDEAASILHALRQHADNAEGRPLPRFLVQLFHSLPISAGEIVVPNYLETVLTDPGAGSLSGCTRQFESLWAQALSSIQAQTPKPIVLEPACGSANDYRFLHSYGVARLIDYRGFDLSPTNIANAHKLFPEAHFEVGNVFQINCPEEGCDYLFVHDLFEHLSLTGLEQALTEVCRVTARSLCLGFFNMDEIREHLERPTDEYHWNTLSMPRIRQFLVTHGFEAQVFHIDTYLRWLLPGQRTHNPNSYTIIGTRRRPRQQSV